MTSQLIAIAIMLLASGFMGTLRWYQKKKIIMDAERAEREREQEILRTGRDPHQQPPTLTSRGEPSRPNQRPREADLMAERQEALRQLRRQQADQAENTDPQPVQRDVGGGTITKELWPGGPVIVVSGPAPSRTAPSPNTNRPMPRTQQELRRPSSPQPVTQQRQPMPQQRPQQQQRPQKAKPVQKRQPQQQSSSPAGRGESRHDEAYYERERSLARMKASNSVERTIAATEPVFVAPRTAHQWRAAFIAAEVLGAPVSMRDQSQPIGCPLR